MIRYLYLEALVHTCKGRQERVRPPGEKTIFATPRQGEKKGNKAEGAIRKMAARRKCCQPDKSYLVTSHTTEKERNICNIVGPRASLIGTGTPSFSSTSHACEIGPRLFCPYRYDRLEWLAVMLLSGSSRILCSRHILEYYYISWYA